MTESQIATAVWNKWGRQGLAAPNIHHYAFESDILVLKKSGYTIEYEIKISHSDFLADRKKKAVISPNDKNKRLPNYFIDTKGISRYEYLEQGLGANRFYYVLPKDLVPEEEIPDWAGIIYARPGRASRVYVHIARSPKKLHSNKAEEKVKDKILQSTYFRYWQNFAVQDLNIKRTK